MPAVMSAWSMSCVVSLELNCAQCLEPPSRWFHQMPETSTA